jgi:hypothetical protein
LRVIVKDLGRSRQPRRRSGRQPILSASDPALALPSTNWSRNARLGPYFSLEDTETCCLVVTMRDGCSASWVYELPRNQGGGGAATWTDRGFPGC